MSRRLAAYNRRAANANFRRRGSTAPRRTVRRRKTRTAPRRRRQRRTSGLSGIARSGFKFAKSLPGPIGSMAQMAEGIYNGLSGAGDYTVRVNSISKGSPVAQFGPDCIRITHKEYLGSVSGSTTFVSTRYAINPALPGTFPWLAPISSRFEQYRINGMVFEFVSTSSNSLNSTNTALGRVVLATQYNSLAAPFSNVTQMLSTQFSNYGKPAQSLMHAIECAPGQVPNELYYCRSSNVFTGDQRLYDLGEFTIATEGMQAVADIGGLWVSYDVTLCKPTIVGGIDEGELLFDSFWFHPTLVDPLLANGAITVQDNGLGGTLSNDSDDDLLYTFAPGVNGGDFKVDVVWYDSTGPFGGAYTIPSVTTVNSSLTNYHAPSVGWSGTDANGGFVITHSFGIHVVEGGAAWYYNDGVASFPTYTNNARCYVYVTQLA